MPLKLAQLSVPLVEILNCINIVEYTMHTLPCLIVLLSRGPFIDFAEKRPKMAIFENKTNFFEKR